MFRECVVVWYLPVALHGCKCILGKKCLRQAKVVVAVSENVGKELVDIGVPQESIRVILNGDLHEFSPGSAEPENGIFLRK